MELIVTLVLVGIIGTFTTLFMYTGLNGYLKAKDTSEGALKAQIALDRISLELRDIIVIDAITPKSDPDTTTDSNIDYSTTTLPGSRKTDPTPLILSGTNSIQRERMWCL